MPSGRAPWYGGREEPGYPGYLVHLDITQGVRPATTLRRYTLVFPKRRIDMRKERIVEVIPAVVLHTALLVAETAVPTRSAL